MNQLMRLLHSLAIASTYLTLLSARGDDSLFDDDDAVRSKGFYQCKRKGDFTVTFGNSVNKHTLSIIKILEKFDARGVFFVNGRALKPKSSGYHRKNKKLLKKLTKKDHIIGISAWDTDISFDESKPKKVLSNVRKSAKMIEKVLGVHPRYVHISKGKISKEVHKLLTKKGYVPIGWNTHPKKKKSVKKFSKKSSHAKSYISYFPDGAKAKKMLKKYLEEIEKKKYEFVSLKKCIGKKKKPYKKAENISAGTSSDDTSTTD